MDWKKFITILLYYYVNVVVTFVRSQSSFGYARENAIFCDYTRYCVGPEAHFTNADCGNTEKIEKGCFFDEHARTVRPCASLCRSEDKSIRIEEKCPGFPYSNDSLCSDNDQSDEKGLSDGEIAGIVIGAVIGAAILLAVVMIILCVRKRNRGLRDQGETDIELVESNKPLNTQESTAQNGGPSASDFQNGGPSTSDAQNGGNPSTSQFNVHPEMTPATDRVTVRHLFSPEEDQQNTNPDVSLQLNA